jgi:hypothetical protein
LRRCLRQVGLAPSTDVAKESADPLQKPFERLQKTLERKHFAEESKIFRSEQVGCAALFELADFPAIIALAQTK